jgi:hypothetical protein
MPFVDESAGNSSRTGIEIFVGTPDGEIDVPVMEMERQVPRGVGEVDSDDAPALLRRRRDSLEIKKLSGEKVYTRQKDDRNLVSVPLDQRLDFLLTNGVFPFPRSRQ